VRQQPCQIVSKEELVAYADGDLSPSEAERISGHIATCPDCKAVVEALEHSLRVTQAIWQTARAQWPEARSFRRIRPDRRPPNRAAAVAASILVILGAGAVWRLLSEPSQQPGATDKEPTAAEIEVAASRAAQAAQLLAAADLLSSQPGGERHAMIRYSDVAASYPETKQSETAELRLQNLLERR
jgi:anti-sigma factor RsiW